METARHDTKLIDELRVLSHKLAVVASAGVVSSFEQVLESCRSGFAHGTLSDEEPRGGVMNAVADLTIAMRSDVLHAAAFPSQNTERAVRLNSRRMEKLGDLERHILASTDTGELTCAVTIAHHSAEDTRDQHEDHGTFRPRSLPAGRSAMTSAPRPNYWILEFEPSRPPTSSR